MLLCLTQSFFQGLCLQLKTLRDCCHELGKVHVKTPEQPPIVHTVKVMVGA